ncbi:MAG TPA: 16S rRNA processing protein RimM [Anaerolineae bacterium]|nr:16S rRNA processing protein RimM [Anaerolineae bacterium]HIQ06045.1 16S rRNA processing protein RimM [Anaerolineae bacterium]
MDRTEKEELIAIGRIVAPHGIRGELKVESHSDYPDRFTTLQEVYVGDETRPRQILEVRPYRRHFRIRLEGCEDRNTAETLRGAWLRIPLSQARPLEKDEYFVHQIIGLHVVTTEGETLGTITEVIFTGSNEVYVTEGPQGEVLIPALASVVLDVNLEEKRLLVHLPPGLTE